MNDEQFLAECKSSLSSPAAFPTPILGSEGTLLGCVHGMSLRDWFAGMALNGNLACESPDFCCKPNSDKGLTREDVMAIDCYKLADAMLKARGQ